MRDFYNKELEALDKKQAEEQNSGRRLPDPGRRNGYLNFMKFLAGENKLGKKLNKCNALEPATHEQYEDLRREAMNAGKDLYQTIMTFEDNVHPSKYKSLYTTILNYLKPKTDGAKVQSNYPNNGAFGPVQNSRHVC